MVKQKNLCQKDANMKFSLKTSKIHLPTNLFYAMSTVNSFENLSYLENIRLTSTKPTQFPYNLYATRRGVSHRPLAHRYNNSFFVLSFAQRVERARPRTMASRRILPQRPKCSPLIFFNKIKLFSNLLLRHHLPRQLHPTR